MVEWKYNVAENGNTHVKYEHKKVGLLCGGWVDGRRWRQGNEEIRTQSRMDDEGFGVYRLT